MLEIQYETLRKQGQLRAQVSITKDGCLEVFLGKTSEQNTNYIDADNFIDKKVFYFFIKIDHHIHL
jgi:hypothetical protein